MGDYGLHSCTSEWALMADSCEHGIEPKCSVKFAEFLYMWYTVYMYTKEPKEMYTHFNVKTSAYIIYLISSV
jgi:hypothetical protein